MQQSHFSLHILIASPTAYATQAVLVKVKLIPAFLHGKEKRNVMVDTVLADSLQFGKDSRILFALFK